MRRRTFLLGAAGLGALAISTACGRMQMGGASSAPFDQQFIDMMVPHHQGAIEMAKIAQQRGEHAEVKKLAQGIVGSQSSEIERMKGWRKAWFGSDQTPGMDKMPMVEGMSSGSTGGMNHGGGATTMDMAADVEKLRKAPEPFDRAFIDAMIPHHESAIDAAKAAESRAQKPEIKQLAKEIVAAQQTEIDQMKGWRKSWFGA
jgi:uncharacterized protein (DUF305 family)